MSAVITLGRALWRVLLQYLICAGVLWHRKPEPIPFLLLATSLQQILTVRASFLYKWTGQQHIKSAVSQKHKTKTHTHTPNKQNPQNNPLTFFLCFVISPWHGRNVPVFLYVEAAQFSAGAIFLLQSTYLMLRSRTLSAVQDSFLHPCVTTETTLIALHLSAFTG